MSVRENNNNKPIFYFIAFVLPIVLLLLLELFLRGIGYGKHYPLFVESQDFSGYMQPNPDIIQRYFPSPELAPRVSPDTQYFPLEKGDDVFRIVVQGGSSAAGFPYGRFGSLQGMLAQRLKRTFPDKKIEVINTAMAAVNSYTLLDFVEEIKAIEPDAVFIYTGHNEYLGVLGAGSALAGKGGRSATLSFLYLKDLKLYQLLEQLVQLFSPEVNAAASNERTLMAKVAKGKQIEYDSELYQLGLMQFAGNLHDITEKYVEAGIPVFLGTLASIEREMPPFSTVGKSLDEHSSGQSYQLGLDALQQGNYEEAKAAFQRARDLDGLRFRAPSAFNDIVRNLSKQEGITLVDVETQIRNDSEHGIIGLSHMLEHVHPTLRGYFLLSESFYQSLLESGLIGKEQHTFSTNQAWQDVPVNQLDKMWAELKIAQLKSDYPFRATPVQLNPPETKTFEGKLLMRRAQGENWLALQQELLGYYLQANNLSEAAKVAGVLSDAMLNNAEFANQAAAIYRAQNELLMARYYQARTLSLAPENPQYLMNQAQHQYMLGALEESLNLLQQAESKLQNPIKARFFIDKVKAELRAKESKGE